ncbi:MAG TPA: hypothetical protein VJW17_08740 [Pyrinomonadaceae bacterium]|nr:hypothetical protein [Pyrinomonadaceae bacterium]
MKILSRTARKINRGWYARIRYEDNNGNKESCYVIPKLTPRQMRRL